MAIGNSGIGGPGLSKNTTITQVSSTNDTTIASTAFVTTGISNILSTVNTWTARQIFNAPITITPPNVLTTNAVTINIPASVLTGSAGALVYNPINIGSSGSPESLAGIFMADWGINHFFGGTSLTGSRVGSQSLLTQVGSSPTTNALRYYTAYSGFSQCNVSTGDGGTNTGAGSLGGYFGANFGSRVQGSNIYNNAAMELDVGSASSSNGASSTASMKYQWALSLVNQCAVQASVLDVGLVIYSGTQVATNSGGPWGGASTDAVPSKGFANGIVFAEIESNALPPLSSSATLLCGYVSSLSNIPITTGIDLTKFSISGNAFISNGFTVSGTNSPINLTLNGATTGPVLSFQTNSSGIGAIGSVNACFGSGSSTVTAISGFYGLNFYTNNVLAFQLNTSGGVSIGTTSDPGVGLIYQNSASFLMRTKTSWTNGAGGSTGTLTNAPAGTNPTKWIPVDDNGTTRYIPAW